MEVKGFDHLVLNVEDVDKALKFYSQILGLDVLRLDEYRRGEAPFPSVRISADSAMKWTPQKTIHSASLAAAMRDNSNESPVSSACSMIASRW